MENFIFWAMSGKIFCSSFDKNTFENYLVVPKKIESCISFSQRVLFEKHHFRIKNDPFPLLLPSFNFQPVIHALITGL